MSDILAQIEHEVSLEKSIEELGLLTSNHHTTWRVFDKNQTTLGSRFDFIVFWNTLNTFPKLLIMNTSLSLISVP